MQPNESTDKENAEFLDTGEATDHTELSKLQADKIFRNLSMLVPAKFIRTEKVVNLIKESKKVVIDKNFIVDGTATGINLSIFLYDLQQ